MGQGAEERALIVVPVEGMGEAGEVGLVAARLNHFSGLWGTGLSLVVWWVKNLPCNARGVGSIPSQGTTCCGATKPVSHNY